jgi:hypothetical protein
VVGGVLAEVIDEAFHCCSSCRMFDHALSAFA